MPVIDVKGDMLKAAPTGALIGIPVNCVGVAGKGLALYMKLRFKHTFAIYRRAYRNGRLITGPLTVVDEQGFKIALIPTKYDWRNPSDERLIADSVERLVRYMTEHDIKECHLPRIGCGRETGTLDYDSQVKPILEKHFNRPFPIAYVYY